jgi:predicted ATPase/DNA-binding winged helix-turn-helix (wHTH) protein
MIPSERHENNVSRLLWVGTARDTHISTSNVLYVDEPAYWESQEYYEFAGFRLLPAQRKLLLGNSPINLGGRAFDLLANLVSQAGVVVSSGDLIRAVWHGIVVEEANLRVQIAALRKALSRYKDACDAIETVPLRGYCFTLPARHHSKSVKPSVRNSIEPPVLPTPPSPIVGQDDAISAIEMALNERRLVTITGPGGIGKTTVALATAKRYAFGYKGAIAFIDLSRVVDGAETPLFIAAALGIEPRGDPLGALRHHLRDLELLLILDTCEHLVEPVASLAESLLASCDNLKILVTSREALRARGEWMHRLSSLQFPAAGEIIDQNNFMHFSAVQLFIERVQSTMRFELENDMLPTVAEICRRLDGIPLALEFAAARAFDLGLLQIAAHLDDRFAILTRGRRMALPRHRTLSAALDWSYSLLSTDERRLLRSLAALMSPFTAEQAIEIGESEGCERPREALSGLYDKSLLGIDVRGQAPLYLMLNSIRAYVANVRLD